MSCRGFAHHMDVDSSARRDKKISQGLKQWDERDKMTCDHTEPGKEVKCPDLLGTPLDYIESCRVFKSKKMSEHDLCHFYKVGLSGNFPQFPTTHKPATNDHMCGFWRMPGSAPGQTCLWHSHRMQSHWFACFKHFPPMPAFNALR